MQEPYAMPAARISPRPSVDYRQLLSVCWEQLAGMVVFKTMKYYGVPPRVTAAVLILLSIFLYYHMHVFVVGFLFGSGDNSNTNSKEMVFKAGGNVAVINGAAADSKLMDNFERAGNPKIGNVQGNLQQGGGVNGLRTERAVGVELAEQEADQIKIEQKVDKVPDRRKLLAYDAANDGVKWQQPPQDKKPPERQQKQMRFKAEQPNKGHEPDLGEDRDARVPNINHDVSKYVYFKKDAPIIWLMGVPRSGVALMRVLLDAHPDVRCSEEIPAMTQVIQMHKELRTNMRMLNRLQEANINKEVIHNALGGYLMSILAGTIKEDSPSVPKWLCNKDTQLVQAKGPLLHQIFPNSKTILMLRDGRAVIESALRVKGTSATDVFSVDRDLKLWNRMIESQLKLCEELGPSSCRVVRYESLVLHPRQELAGLLDWLQVTWHDSVLHHEQTVGKPGGASFSGNELSTKELKQPINLLSLYKWTEKFPQSIRTKVNTLAPLLSELGYDTVNYPPTYGEPEPEVLQKSQHLENKHKYREIDDF